MKDKQPALNFNTFLLVLLGAVTTLGVNKLYDGNTALTKVITSQDFIIQRVQSVETRMSEMVLKTEFQTEINRLNHELDRINPSRHETKN